MKTARQWPPRGRYRDERLVFLAAEPQLRRLARPGWLVLLSGFSFRRQDPTRARKDTAHTRMVWLVEACDNVAQTLSPEDMAEVRAHGVLPPWFMDAVKDERKIVRRRHR